MYLNKKSKNEKFSFKCWEVTNIILNGTIGIVIVNSFYSFIAYQKAGKIIFFFIFQF